jgi:hypothetical protein
MRRHEFNLATVAVLAIIAVATVLPGCAKRSSRESTVAEPEQREAASKADEYAPMPRPIPSEPSADVAATSFQGPPLKPPQPVAQANAPGEVVLPPAPIPESSASSSGASSGPPAAPKLLETDPGGTNYVSPSLELDQSRLIRRREEWTEAEVAADALGRIGAPATPQIVIMLNDPDPRIRRRGAEILARIGSDAEVAIPALIGVVEQDPDLQVRKAAAFALGQMGPKAEAAIPALTRMMRSSQK